MPSPSQSCENYFVTHLWFDVYLGWDFKGKIDDVSWSLKQDIERAETDADDRPLDPIVIHNIAVADELWFLCSKLDATR